MYSYDNREPYRGMKIHLQEYSKTQTPLTQNPMAIVLDVDQISLYVGISKKI